MRANCKMNRQQHINKKGVPSCTSVVMELHSEAKDWTSVVRQGAAVVREWVSVVKECASVAKECTSMKRVDFCREGIGFCNQGTGFWSQGFQFLVQECTPGRKGLPCWNKELLFCRNMLGFYN